MKWRILIFLLHCNIYAITKFKSCCHNTIGFYALYVQFSYTSVKLKANHMDVTIDIPTTEKQYQYTVLPR
jgi:hypothetical protein